MSNLHSQSATYFVYLSMLFVTDAVIMEKDWLILYTMLLVTQWSELFVTWENFVIIRIRGGFSTKIAHNTVSLLVWNIYFLSSAVHGGNVLFLNLDYMSHHPGWLVPQEIISAPTVSINMPGYHFNDSWLTKEKYKM